MSVEPMKKAAQALELLLRSIPEDCYFDVVSFGSCHDSLFQKVNFILNHPKSLSLAQTMNSNYDGTEIFKALNGCLKIQKIICQLLYYLLQMVKFEMLIKL